MALPSASLSGGHLDSASVSAEMDVPATMVPRFDSTLWPLLGLEPEFWNAARCAFSFHLFMSIHTLQLSTLNSCSISSARVMPLGAVTPDWAAKAQDTRANPALLPDRTNTQ